MHLFSPEDFALRFGIDMSVPDFSAAVFAASRAATRSIASAFRFQDFDLQTARRDFFRCDRMHATGTAQNRQFMLARGFIDGGAGFSAYYTENPVHIRNGDADLYTNLQNTNEDGQSDYIMIDAEQGVVTVYTLDMTDQWVVITYNCGFSVASDDEYEGVPNWLKDAAEAQAILYLKQNRAFKGENETAADLDPMRNNLRDLMHAHGRFFPAAVKPTASEPGR